MSDITESQIIIFFLAVRFILDSVWLARRHLFYKRNFVGFVT